MSDPTHLISKRAAGRTSVHLQMLHLINLRQISNLMKTVGIVLWYANHGFSQLIP